MKDVESRRIVPVATITLTCVGLLALFQVIMLTGAFEIKSSTVRKIAPWFYEPFRKLVGEHPSTNPMARQNAIAAEKKKSGTSDIATVAGFNPEELAVTIENVEEPVLDKPVPVEEPKVIIPVSQPAKPTQPVDEDIPVG